jgi:oxygen-independent coproporphyrinogen-3 oxidase
MQTALPDVQPLNSLDVDPDRPLLVGVLPHTFCNPRVHGCGFCTFPHEKYARDALLVVGEQVRGEIEETVQRHPSLARRRVEAIYLGGGTANLVPPEELDRLCRVLTAAFDLASAELTLEGVPRYFLTRDEGLLDVLARAPVRHRRISMGIQTFDSEWLRRMGRSAFGDREDFARVVDAAHRRGFTASADLLFNLPGATLSRAIEDVVRATDLGLDQICVYNLVLAAELDTEWARDTVLVQAMPNQERAFATWMAVRETLIDRGYVQRTLTNFERAEIARSERTFVYELASFDPARCDAIGFGPGAISTFTSGTHWSAVKWSNVASSREFCQARSTGRGIVARIFDYSRTDLRLLHLTRNLSRLSIDRMNYQDFFGTDACADFAPQIDVLDAAGLVRCDAGAVRLTPAGMFYADAVAGLLAHQRQKELRRPADHGSAMHHHMG